MALHSLAHPFPYVPKRGARPRLTPGITIPERNLSAASELRIYLRQRRANWKPILFSLAVAGISLGLWAALISRLA